MKKILLADDHSIVHEGMKSFINARNDFNIVGSAYSGKEVLKKIGSKKFDLIILDISMPDKNIYQLVHEIRKINEELPIIIYSIYEEEHYAIRLLEIGVNGYLNKSAGIEEITFAIEKVLQGKMYISQNLAEYYAKFMKTGNNKPHHTKLSSREYEIFIMLASGETTNMIAKKLYVSKSTVSNHRHQIMKKLGVTNSVQITLYAIKYDLIDPKNLSWN